MSAKTANSKGSARLGGGCMLPPRSCTRAAVLLTTLLLIIAASTHSAAAAADRPGGAFDVSCGGEGMAACGACGGTAEVKPPWCRADLQLSGCLPGLSRLSVTPTPHMQLEEPMPDVCLAMPEEGIACGVAGKPCCLSPSTGKPATLVRALCEAPLECMVADLAALPYGGSRHMAAVLAHSNSTGLLQADVMGTCLPWPPPQQQQQQSRQRQQQPAPTNLVLGECGRAGQPCPRGTYCAANEDHLLGGARCLPLPECGRAGQPCCPPFADGRPPQRSIADSRTAVPTCLDPDAVCVWPSTLASFEATNEPAGGSAASGSAGLMRPPDEVVQPGGSVSVAAQFPRTLCLPGLARCGGEGQPCCPHAQFAASNLPMFWRLHTCDPGLRCNETISVFGDGPVRLGVCQGVRQRCGQLGEPCCKHTDAAGWQWQSCADGQPGDQALLCTPGGTCQHCPSDRATAQLVTSERPGVLIVC